MAYCGTTKRGSRGSATSFRREIWGEAVATKCTTFLAVNLPGEQWHNPWSHGEVCPPASTRAALVLSAVGCPLDDKRSLYANMDLRQGI